MKEKIMPPLVLMIISVVVCALLVAANAATKDKIIQAQEDKFNQSLTETFGEADYKSCDVEIDEIFGIDSVTRDENGRIIFEITADGYAKGGLHLLIGFDPDGEIEGISFLSIGETPGLGTKVQEDKSFVEQFKGLSAEQFMVTSSDYDFKPITGATFSSKGMRSAVDSAMIAYYEHKEEILNG